MGIISFIKKKTDDTSPEDKNNTHTDLKSHILNNKKDTEQNLEKAKEEIKKKMQEINNTNKDKPEKETKSKTTGKNLEKTKEEIKKKVQEKEQKNIPEPATQKKSPVATHTSKTHQPNNITKNHTKPEKSKNAAQKKDAAQSANNNQKTKETKEQKKTQKNTKKATCKTDKKDENKKTEKEATKNEEDKKIAVSSILNKIGNQRDIDISGGTVVETYNLNADNVYATVTIYNVPNQYKENNLSCSSR